MRCCLWPKAPHPSPQEAARHIVSLHLCRMWALRRLMRATDSKFPQQRRSSSLGTHLAFSIVCAFDLLLVFSSFHLCASLFVSFPLSFLLAIRLLPSPPSDFIPSKASASCLSRSSEALSRAAACDLTRARRRSNKDKRKGKKDCSSFVCTVCIVCTVCAFLHMSDTSLAATCDAPTLTGRL